MKNLALVVSCIIVFGSFNSCTSCKKGGCGYWGSLEPIEIEHQELDACEKEIIAKMQDS